MFGFGSNRRRGRTETFAPSRIRGAALAGIGMLAWQWWRKRHQTSRPGTNPNEPFSESSRTPSASTY
jgi:hypothetical protein